MRIPALFRTLLSIMLPSSIVLPSSIMLLAVFALTACSPAAAPAAPTAASPEWFAIQMTDVTTGQPFSINDFKGKVVLLETMATWCPTCWQQELQVKKLHGLLGNTPDLVEISLDVDSHEDEALLKDFAKTGDMDWRFAVAPIKVQHDLGNLYSAEYLNPPLVPMLIIDRAGSVYNLPYGLKSAEQLQKTLEPYLKSQ